MSIAITLLALLIEATLGYPQAVLRAIGHPVMWLGRMIGSLDDTLNREPDGPRRRAAGFVAAFLISRHPRRRGLRDRERRFASAVRAHHRCDPRQHA